MSAASLSFKSPIRVFGQEACILIVVQRLEGKCAYMQERYMQLCVEHILSCCVSSLSSLTSQLHARDAAHDISPGWQACQR
jgi:hypothetical protein